MPRKRRLQTLNQYYQLPGEEIPVDDTLCDLAELLEADIIQQDGGTILRIVDDHTIFPYADLKDIADHLRTDLYCNWHFAIGGDDSFVDPTRFVFFDTETTGLSGGTGMMIFLCGFGRFIDNTTFRVTQYFLPDYPNEPLLLKLSGDELPAGSIMVSYNGKSFDWPMLVGRLTLNRMPIPELDDHLDILHPARSLFRRLGEDCSLISMEKCLLSFDRGDDIPGYMIPMKYFDYLYDRQPGMIPEIIRHNRLDVISLALVTRCIPEVLGRPERINGAPLLEGVINHFFRHRRFNDLHTYMQQIGPGYFDESSLIARLQYSLALKSLGYFDDASAIWRSATDTDDDPVVLRHLLELAKHQEHREKDPENALETVNFILQLELNPSQRNEMIHRQKRLNRKLNTKLSKPL